MAWIKAGDWLFVAETIVAVRQSAGEIDVVLQCGQKIPLSETQYEALREHVAISVSHDLNAPELTPEEKAAQEAKEVAEEEAPQEAEWRSPRNDALFNR